MFRIKIELLLGLRWRYFRLKLEACASAFSDRLGVPGAYFGVDLRGLAGYPVNLAFSSLFGPLWGHPRGGSWDLGPKLASNFDHKGARWPSKIRLNNNDMLKALWNPILIGLVPV